MYREATLRSTAAFLRGGIGATARRLDPIVESRRPAENGIAYKGMK
jgi:hypothetical protein